MNYLYSFNVHESELKSTVDLCRCHNLPSSIGVIFTKHLSKYHLTIEAFLSFLQITQVFQHRSEVVDILGHLGMIWSVDCLVNLQSSLKESLSTLIIC